MPGTPAGTPATSGTSTPAGTPGSTSTPGTGGGRYTGHHGSTPDVRCNRCYPPATYPGVGSTPATTTSTDRYMLAGRRVQAHPGTDAWLSGDRFGVVVAIGRKWIHVRMHRSGRVLRFTPARLVTTSGAPIPATSTPAGTP